MPHKTKYSTDEKIAILNEYFEGQTTITATATKYGIRKDTLREWIFHYEEDGYDWFLPKLKNKIYPVELKYQAVRDYLSGEYTLHQIMSKYKILHQSKLTNWISMYNGQGTLKSNGNGGATALARRTTSLDERLTIVLYCISLGNDYSRAAHEYQVSYHQVYQWVKKFRAGGKDALEDCRGRRKTEEELTDDDRHRRTVMKLEQQIELLKMENALLKKLNELEGK